MSDTDEEIDRLAYRYALFHGLIKSTIEESIKQFPIRSGSNGAVIIEYDDADMPYDLYKKVKARAEKIYGAAPTAC